jgi:thioredoxin-dependent peroxiredoxin
LTATKESFEESQQDKTKMLYLTFAAIIAIVATCSAFTPSKLAAATGLFRLQMIKVGDVAPDFELLTSVGEKVKLSSFKSKKSVVVFFYPADNTPGCTAEACQFEKRAPDFKSKGAEVVGISSGSAADKDKFIKANKLNNMKLLIDAGDKVRKSWEVPRALFGAFPGRVTYVIGKDGTVKFIYDDLGNAALHPEKALDALAALK